MAGDDIKVAGSEEGAEVAAFDLQAAADLASSLALLFRTRKIKPDTEDAMDAKGKEVSMYETSIRTARRTINHEAIRHPPRHLATSQKSLDKLRKSVLVHMHYLIATTTKAKDDAIGAEEEAWHSVVKVGTTGDKDADELVAKAQRRLTLLRTQNQVSRSSVLEVPTEGRQHHTRLPSPTGSSKGRRSPPRRRGSKFEVGGESSDVETPASEIGDPLAQLSPPPTSSFPAPPSPTRSRKSATFSPRLRMLTKLFPGAGASPKALTPTIALETEAQAFLAPRPLRDRTASVVSLVDPFLQSTPDLLPMQRKTSSASLPDFASRPLATPESKGRFRPRRVWVDEAAAPAEEDAASILRDALRKHREASGEQPDMTSSPTPSPTPSPGLLEAGNWPKPKRPSLPAKASTLRSLKQQAAIRGVDPRLATLEEASRVNVVTACAVCEAKGVNVRSTDCSLCFRARS